LLIVARLSYPPHEAPMPNGVSASTKRFGGAHGAWVSKM